MKNRAEDGNSAMVTNVLDSCLPVPVILYFLSCYVCEVIARDFSIACSSLTERKRIVVVLAHEGDPRASQRPVNLPMMQQHQEDGEGKLVPAVV
ncbi:hypothetical protein ACFX1S_044762 [Malus domestica]